MIFSIYSNPIKDSQIIIHDLIDYLCQKDVEIRIDEQSAKTYGYDEYSATEYHLGQADIMVVLGGDGTLLGRARQFSSHNIPLFGINLGNLGFLTQAEVFNYKKYIDLLLDGQYHLDQRTMLEVKADADECWHLATNDAMLVKTKVNRINDIIVRINGQIVDQYTGDGVIVATPTGSTAYSLSVGGPIVNSNSKTIVITPLSAHTLNARPIVTSDEDVITIEGKSPSGEMILYMDAQDSITLQDKTLITIRKAAATATFVAFEDKRNVFEFLREKLSCK